MRAPGFEVIFVLEGAGRAPRCLSGIVPREGPWTRQGREAQAIMPAPTVSFVASSMRMNEPVVRLSA
jgi:hypothetical protein